MCVQALARLGERGKEERRHVRPSEDLRRYSRPNAGGHQPHPRAYLARSGNIAGFSGVLFRAGCETGKALSITFWKSDQGMRNSEEEASRLRSESAEAGGETIAGVERYEAPIFEVSLTGGGEERGFMDRLTGR